MNREQEIEERIAKTIEQLQGFGWSEKKIQSFVKSMRREYANPALAERGRV